MRAFADASVLLFQELKRDATTWSSALLPLPTFSGFFSNRALKRRWRGTGGAILPKVV